MTLPAAIHLGQVVDGDVRWQPAPSLLDRPAGTWPDPILTGWARHRARDHEAGALAAVHATDGGLWQLTLAPATEAAALVAVPWAPTRPDAQLSPTLLEATGFQVSHALRSPLSRLVGHHTLAVRALDAQDPTAAKVELDAAARAVQDQLDTADRLATTLTALIARPRQARGGHDAPGLVAAAREALTGLGDTAPQTRLHLEVDGGGADRGTLATIEVGEPRELCADSVAVVAAYLRDAWDVEAVLVTHGHRLWRLSGPASSEARLRTIAAEDLDQQALAVGRSIAQGCVAGAIGFAAALAELLQASGEVTLTRTRAEHRRLAALLALADAGGPVLLDADGELVAP